MKKILIYDKSSSNKDVLAEKLKDYEIQTQFIDDTFLNFTLEDAFQTDSRDLSGNKQYCYIYVFLYGLSNDEIQIVNSVLNEVMNQAFILVSFTETNRRWTLKRIMEETEEEHEVFVKSTELMSYIRTLAQRPVNQVPAAIRQMMVEAYSSLQEGGTDRDHLDAWIKALKDAVDHRDVYVFGAANIDICGRTDHPIVLHDSNIGETSISFGGVGRNIARFLASLGETPRFVSCFSNDMFGRMLRKDCIEKGIDCSLSLDSDRHSSFYLAVLDHAGDMHVAVNDMKLLEDMDPQYYVDILRSMKQEDILLLDANLNEACVKAVFENAHCTVAADPVSVAKVSLFESYLPKITFFKPNQYESEKLTGIRIEDLASGISSLDWFLERGIREIAITLGKNGVLFGNLQGKWYYSHSEVEVVNATGGGDAFMSGYIHGRLQGKTANDAIKYAIATAIYVVGSDLADRERMTDKTVTDILKEIEIEEQIL